KSPLPPFPGPRNLQPGNVVRRSSTNFGTSPEYLTGGDETFGPDYGGATVYTVERKDFATDCPNLAKLLENLTFDLPMENEIMGKILDDKQKPNEAAAEWIKANPDRLDAWLEGVTTLDGQDGLPAVKSSLGLS
ncbi:glycine betaine ABC transporter substrate-binding protein, partial [Aurantimonas sp. C2-5-R2]|uniref:glycine betaine ABC transporter substrate-binding protein n=1 Tax=Aurantimonas sp. C2-5-R2 TaxID=3113713 RepID=UPI002F935CA6